MTAPKDGVSTQMHGEHNQACCQCALDAVMLCRLQSRVQ